MHGTSIETTIYYRQKGNGISPMALRQHLYLKRNYLLCKRGMDIATALLVSILVFPWLFPIIMLTIRLDSRGAVFFRQKRVGFLGKTFWCYKFRTMYINDEADTRQAVRGDTRVTRVGRFLRDTGLDELPQFINVLLGQMSIVGPRPHMLKDSREFSEVVSNYRFRNLVKPGITGMSQVRGCRGPASTLPSIFRRYQWDAYYVRNANFFLDMKIMMETGRLMFKSLLNVDKHGMDSRPEYRQADLGDNKSPDLIVSGTR